MGIYPHLVLNGDLSGRPSVPSTERVNASLPPGSVMKWSFREIIADAGGQAGSATLDLVRTEDR